MKKFLIIIILKVIIVSKPLLAGNWCKAVYSIEMTQGELKEQISKCRTSDNFFLAIHNSYSNAGNLLNSFIAERCNLNRRIITSSANEKDPYFSMVCEYSKNFLRE